MRRVFALRMAVPEAAMHEYRCAILKEHDVRFARQILRGNAVAKPLRKKILSNRDLRFGIAPPYSGHHPAACRSINNVHHS